MRVVLLGPPGSGKGTQAKLLEQRFGVVQISTGEMFRKAVAEKTGLGIRVEKYLSSGELVPDDLTISLMSERLKEEDVVRGFVLDGFPRTIPQAEGVEKILADHGWKLDAVINISVPTEVLVRRLALRRTCPACGMMYHLEHRPPRVEGECTSCGGVLETREDDNEETVRNRLQVYFAQTASLVDYYKDRSQLVEIDGSGGVDEIFASLHAELERRYKDVK
jgi:adenylate kinase